MYNKCICFYSWICYILNHLMLYVSIILRCNIRFCKTFSMAGLISVARGGRLFLKNKAWVWWGRQYGLLMELVSLSGIILCMLPANKRWRYKCNYKCNVISYCLGAFTKWSLHCTVIAGVINVITSHDVRWSQTTANGINNNNVIKWQVYIKALIGQAMWHQLTHLNNVCDFTWLCTNNLAFR